MKIVIEVTEEEVFGIMSNSFSEIDEVIRERAEDLIGDYAWDAEIRMVK